jgi:hypothetical protein
MRLPALSLLWFLTAPGCAVEERTGKALADAVAAGPARDYAGARADALAESCLEMYQKVAPDGGGPADLAGAQLAFARARAAHDSGVAVFLIVAPELEAQLEGEADDPLAVTGLPVAERALFATPPAPAAEQARATALLRDAALALHRTLPAGGQPADAAALVGSLAAVAARVANKLDGSSSLYAGAARLSVESNLVGVQALYGLLAPLVQGADAARDQQITALLQQLLAQIRAVASLDELPDKAQLLRECAALSQALSGIAPLLGLMPTSINLS